MKKKKEKLAVVKCETKSRELVNAPQDVVSAVILNGDLSRLDPTQKIQYYNAYCSRIGLDPMTKPFDLITLDGKQVIYATRACAQQLNKLHNVSHQITSREIVQESYYVVTCRASLPSGRYTDSIGAVPIKGMAGAGFTNAIMKAETKSKRRATLDLLGLGILDESEADSIPGARVEHVPIKQAEGEIVGMAEKDFNVCLDLIDMAESLEALKTVYINAYKKAQEANDKNAMKSFETAKDNRKKQLEGAK